MFALDFHQRDVGAFVQADDFGAVFLVVIELHAHLVRPFDNVRIGENVAVAIDDEAGTLSFQHTFARCILLEGQGAERGRQTEEVFKHLRRQAVKHRRFLDAAFHFDADHRILGLCDQGGEVGGGVGKTCRDGKRQSQHNQCFIHQYLCLL